MYGANGACDRGHNEPIDRAAFALSDHRGKQKFHKLSAGDPCTTPAATRALLNRCRHRVIAHRCSRLRLRERPSRTTAVGRMRSVRRRCPDRPVRSALLPNLKKKCPCDTLHTDSRERERERERDGDTRPTRCLWSKRSWTRVCAQAGRGGGGGRSVWRAVGAVSDAAPRRGCLGESSGVDAQPRGEQRTAAGGFAPRLPTRALSVGRALDDNMGPLRSARAASERGVENVCVCTLGLSSRKFKGAKTRARTFL